MNRIYNLTCYFGKDRANRLNLKTCSNMFDLDKFIQENFRGKRDVIKKYQDEIEKFCFFNNKSLDKDISVGIIAEIKDNDNVVFFHEIPIIYHKIILSNQNCLKRIKETLEDDKILRVLLEKKGYLLSQNEKDLLILYFNFHNKKNKEDAIAFLINRIKKINDSSKYYYFRSLIYLCKLNGIRVKGNVIKNINENIPNRITIVKKDVVYRSNDDYFNSLIEKEDYDELFNLYSLDYINSHSDIFDTTYQKTKKGD